MIFLIGLIVFMLLWFANFHFKRRRIYELGSKLRGPPALPFLGNILQCMVRPEDVATITLDGMKTYKSPSRLWLGPYLAVHITNPKHVQIVLNSQTCLGKSFLYKFSENAFGKSIFNLPVAKWKDHRRVISPIFNQKNLEGFFQASRKYSKSLVENLRVKQGQGAFDVEKFLNKTTLDVVLETIFNFDGSKSDISHGNFVKWIDALQAIDTKRFTNVWLYFDFIFDRTKIGKEYRKYATEYNDYMDKILEEWKAKISRNEVKNKDEEDDDNTERGPKKHLSFVEHMLSLSEEEGKFTNEELRDDIKTLLIGGMETTASSVGFALLALGMHPDVQEKLYMEIMQIVGLRDIEYDDLKHLTYLDMVVKETLRIFSVGMGVSRTNTEDIQLDEYTIPADTILLIGLHTVHRDPDNYPNPTKFDPDRFSPEEVDKRHPYSFIPFSVGPRNCVGWRFGLLSIKVLLIDLVRNYAIKTPYKDVESVGLIWEFVLKPTLGYNVSLEARL